MSGVCNPGPLTSGCISNARETCVSAFHAAARQSRGAPWKAQGRSPAL